MAESLPDDIASFLVQSEHRDIRVSVEESLSKDVVRALREGSAPLGICWDAADLEGFETRPYRTDALSAVVHPSHPLAARETCTFEQTLAFEHVGMPAQTAVYTMLARASAILGKPMSYRVVVSSFDASLRCVRANLGLAIMPKEVVGAMEDSLGVRVVPLTDAWAKRRFAIVFRAEAGLSPAARLLVDHLVAKAQESAPER